MASAIAAHDPALIRIAKDVIDSGSQTTQEGLMEIESAALERRKAQGAMAWDSAPPR